MKLHLFHLAPHGLVRAYSHVVAGRRLCRATGNPTKGLFPRSVNSMTAAWNFYQTVKAQPLEPPKTILDIGANTSQMSRLLAMACPSAPKLYSFEPNEALQPMGTVFRIALSDADGEASFYLPSNDDDWGTIEAGKANADSARKVQCRRFDTLLKDGTLRAEDLPRPVLAKIDTEGSEMRVINGFGDSLKLVDYLLVEVENIEARGQNYNLLTLSSQLREAGFNHAKILYACYDGPMAPAYSDILFWR